MKNNILSRLTGKEKTLKSQLKNCDDVIFKEFYAGSFIKHSCMLIYIDGLCDKKLLNEYVLKPLSVASLPMRSARLSEGLLGALSMSGIPASELFVKKSTEEAVTHIMSGDCVMLVKGYGDFFVIGARGMPRRAVSEPRNKTTIRGPRDGFTENMRDNTALIRSKIKSPKLKMTSFKLGDTTNTPGVICWLEGCADVNLVKRVSKDVISVKLKSVLGSGFIEKELEKKKPSFFPQMEATERPDEAARALLAGRIVVIVDTTPFVLIIPGLFKSMMSSNEDFYEGGYKQKIFLSLRITAMALTLVLPAMYIAIVEYSPEFVSEKLISFIIRSRKDIPFPAFFEILLVEFIFEVLIEAGIRLPAQIGFTVGIVGTIVLGQAMVDANIVNITVVIFVALTAILVFVIPNYSMALSVRMLKFVYMGAAWLSGFFGIAIAALCTLIELCDMSFYGMEYMLPYVDSEMKLKDVEKKESGDVRHNL